MSPIIIIFVYVLCTRKTKQDKMYIHYVSGAIKYCEKMLALASFGIIRDKRYRKSAIEKEEKKKKKRRRVIKLLNYVAVLLPIAALTSSY